MDPIKKDIYMIKGYVLVALIAIGIAILLSGCSAWNANPMTGEANPNPNFGLYGNWTEEEALIITQSYIRAAHSLMACRYLHKEYPIAVTNLYDKVDKGVKIFRLNSVLPTKSDALALGKALIGGSMMELAVERIRFDSDDTVHDVILHELLHVIGFVHSQEMTDVETVCNRSVRR